MHQTVREFFRPGGLATGSRFQMRSGDAHVGISITCIRYLMLCALSNALPNSESGDFEAYVKYLDERPFINYALSYFNKHLGECSSDRGVSQLLSLLSKQLTNNPTSYLLENSGWGQTLVAHEQQDCAKDFRNTLLHTATKMKLSRVVEVSLMAGAELENCLQSKTPLIVSAEGGDEATARLLLDEGASIEAKDNNLQTALLLAAMNGHSTMVRLLIDQGANKEATDGKGWTALHVAAGNGHETTVRLLIDRGANKEAIDGKRRTALHLAAENGHETTVRLLVAFGVYKEAEGRNLGCIRVPLSNPRWEGRLPRFLELSRVTRTVEGGLDVEEAYAARMDEWIVWEAEEERPRRGG
jgi:hypothetical protein